MNYTPTNYTTLGAYSSTGIKVSTLAVPTSTTSVPRYVQENFMQGARNAVVPSYGSGSGGTPVNRSALHIGAQPSGIIPQSGQYATLRQVASGLR